jgi:hypothetical protein
MERRQRGIRKCERQYEGEDIGLSFEGRLSQTFKANRTRIIDAMLSNQACVEELEMKLAKLEGHLIFKS